MSQYVDRDADTVRVELATLRARPQPTTAEGIEARRETEHRLEVELARAEGRPSPVWTHKGVM